MARPIRASISLPALRHNYLACKRAAPNARALAVVKADGYGHGFERVARAIPDADGFAILEIDRAVRLRERGFSGEIVLLEGFFEAAELPVIAGGRLSTVVHSEDQIRMLHAARLASLVPVYLKINSGMNRLGVAPAHAKSMLERLAECACVGPITLMTHFATADGPEGVVEAMRRFDQATEGLKLPKSLANSAALFAHPQSHADTVRPGIALYGATPFSNRSAESLGLQPAMSLTSELIAVRELAPGDAVGYGSTFRADKPMRLGVVACGYADGYPRHAPTGTPVVVGGVRTRTVGRVSMDMIAVDLRPVSHARVGTSVTLWGEGLPVDDVAAPAGTVGYELLCALAPRVPVVEVA